MAFREDAMFDENKYYFPEGAAKIRAEQSKQPWLEVSAERDEQGTPGLQVVPDEQKYVGVRDESKGLHEGYSLPAFLPLPAITHPTATHSHVTAHHANGVLPSQIHPWSQPATPDYPRHWAEPIAVPNSQRHWTQPVIPDQQRQYVQPVLHQQSQYAQSIGDQLPNSWSETVPPSHPAQWSQSTTAIAPGGYGEQTYWGPQADQYGNLAPYAQNTGQHSYSSLEAPSHYSDGHASAWAHGTEAGPTLTGSPEVPLIQEAIQPPSGSWSIASMKNARNRKWWIAGGLLGLLIVIGAVIGGVLGGLAAQGSTNSAATAPISDGNNTMTALKSIRQNSKLAVTGYRGENGNYTLRLFFQDPGHHIRFMDKSSVGETWTNPVTLDTLDYEPMPNGSIAAGSYLGVDPQMIDLFYLDTTSTIRGQNFNFWNDRKPLKGAASSINGYPLQVAENTSIACYFPYIVSQDKDNDQIRWTEMLGENPDNDTQPWWTNDTSVNALGSQQTDLVLLPVAQTFFDAGGFVYRSADGNLSVAMKDYTGGATASVSWKDGALSAKIPSDSAIGAFVVGRPYTPEDVNTYILYQDEKGVIQVVWQDGDHWQGPETFDALNDAEVGTDIECLTQGAADSVDVQVSREQDMNRCFFQEKGTGRLKEVWFNGDEWKAQGFVPLD